MSTGLLLWDPPPLLHLARPFRLLKPVFLGQEWWCTPGISILERLKHGDCHEFRVILDIKSSLENIVILHLKQQEHKQQQKTRCGGTTPIITVLEGAEEGRSHELGPHLAT